MGDRPLWQEFLILGFTAVIGGGGWWMWWADREDKQVAEIRDEAGRALEHFLYPVQTRLNANRGLYTILVEGMDLDKLEYNPVVIANAMQNNENLRKTWAEMIFKIQKTNDEIVTLVNDKKAYVATNPELLKKLDEFVVHATEWKIAWTAALWPGLRVPPPPLTPEPPTLRARPFPASLDDTLNAEIVRRTSERSRTY